MKTKLVLIINFARAMVTQDGRNNDIGVVRNVKTVNTEGITQQANKLKLILYMYLEHKIQLSILLNNTINIF